MKVLTFKLKNYKYILLYLILKNFLTEHSIISCKKAKKILMMTLVLKIVNLKEEHLEK
jgi:hypothetical protein